MRSVFALLSTILAQRNYVLAVFCLIWTIPLHADEISGKELVLQGSVTGTKQLLHMVITGDVVAAGGYYNDSLLIFDISDPKSPTLAYTHQLPDLFTDISSNGPYIYCTNLVRNPRHGWLDIFDVSNPYVPTQLSHYMTRDLAAGVDVKDDMVMIGDDDAGITVLDVSDPSSPSIISTNQLWNASYVVINGNLAAVRDGSADSRLVMYDISDPNSIVRLGSAALPDMMQDMVFDGTTVYIAQNDAGVLIYDVTDPETPALKSTINNIGRASDVYITGTRLYVASGERLLIYDVTDKANPVLQLSCQTNGSARSIAVKGSIIAVGTEDSLQIYKLQDVSPRQLSLKGSVSGTQQILHMTITGDVLAAGGFYNSNIEIFDIADPASPTLTYTHALPDLFMGICSEGPYIYCGNRIRSPRQGYLDILDVSDSNSPKLINHYRTRDLPYGLDVDNGVVMVGDYEAGITVLDVTKPEDPTIIDTASQSYAAHIEINGGLAAVRSASSYGNQLHIYDVSDKRSIRRLSSVSIPDMTHDLAFVGSTVYLAQNMAGVLIYDVTNPAAPVLINTIADIGKASGVDVVGNTLYVASGQKLMTYDVTDPASPQIELSCDTYDDARSVVVKDPLIAVGTEDSLQLYMVEQNPLAISYLKEGPYHIGSKLAVHWTSALEPAGTALKFELWNINGRAAELGYAWNELGTDVTEYELPDVPLGEYWIRISSAWDPQYIAYGDTFELLAYNAVPNGYWLGYE